MYDIPVPTMNASCNCVSLKKRFNLLATKRLSFKTLEMGNYIYIYIYPRLGKLK